ncbi:hypothetical protein ACIHIX_35175 [Streptomyces sp. NPDC051913]|uniref:hypothetical protein n=1 Tax=Streptomyces sp. NPDC051913 TaxID=3365676 RepID=UPI0037CE5A37
MVFMEHVDVAVIGGSQSGLAATLRSCGALRPVVLEAADRAGGARPHYYNRLTSLSPARYSFLPGMPFPGADRDRCPHRDEVVAPLTAYADNLDAEIRTTLPRQRGPPHRRRFRGGTGGRWSAVRAGGRGSLRDVRTPYRPALPGLQEFAGQVLHAADYRSLTRSPASGWL